MKNDTSDFDDHYRELERALPSPFSSEVDVDIFGISHQGRIRRKNEDHFLVIRVERNLETVYSNLIESRPGDRFEETAYAMIVADGVGGQETGEVASREAIISLLNLALRTPDWQFRWGSKQRNTVSWRMRDRFRHINNVLFEQATRHAVLSGMSTTMTAALSHGKDLLITHIGDSRAYLLRDGKLKSLTRDHTLADRMLGKNRYPESERLLTELSGVLRQALGKNEVDCQPDIHDFVLHDGDKLLLCTDGLTDIIDDKLIETILNKETTAVTACRSLVDLVIRSGGHDNVTAIVAHYRIPQP